MSKVNLMPMVKINDINMYYESHGEGEALILIAGNGADLSQWMGIIPLLAKNYWVIAFDNRDAGRTDKTDVAYSIETMADDTVGLLDALGIGKAHVLGTSMGGMIAQIIARKYPGRMKGLVLAGTTMKHSLRNHYAARTAAKRVQDGIDPEAWANYALAWSFADDIFENPEAVEMIRNGMLKMLSSGSVGAFLRQVDAISGFDSRDWVGSIKAPTLVLAGEDDIAWLRKNSGEALAKAIPGAKFVSLPGGHVSFLGAPEAFHKHVTEFLTMVDSR